MRRTPATRAGTAVITSDDGSGVRRPARRRRRRRVAASGAPRRCPGAASTRRVGRALRLAEALDRVDHPPQRFEHVVLDLGRRDPRRRDTRRPSGRGPSNRSVHSSSAASPRVANVGDDRRDDLDRVVERRALTRRASRSAARGSTSPPPRLSAGSSVQTSSASTAAWTAISPSSASWSTDGAPMPGRTARIAGRSSTCAFIIT